MTSAAYHRAWRAAHPDYRKRQNELRNARRRRNGRADRSLEYAKRASRAIPELPPLHIGHRLFDLARQVVGPSSSTFSKLHDPLRDDLISEATLALVEGRDPHIAVVRYRATETAYGRMTCELVEYGA